MTQAEEAMALLREQAMLAGRKFPDGSQIIVYGKPIAEVSTDLVERGLASLRRQVEASRRFGAFGKDLEQLVEEFCP